MSDTEGPDLIERLLDIAAEARLVDKQKDVEHEVEYLKELRAAVLEGEGPPALQDTAARHKCGGNQCSFYSLKQGQPFDPVRACARGRWDRVFATGDVFVCAETGREHVCQPTRNCDMKCSVPSAGGFAGMSRSGWVCSVTGRCLDPMYDAYDPSNIYQTSRADKEGDKELFATHGCLEPYGEGDELVDYGTVMEFDLQGDGRPGAVAQAPERRPAPPRRARKGAKRPRGYGAKDGPDAPLCASTVASSGWAWSSRDLVVGTDGASADCKTKMEVEMDIMSGFWTMRERAGAPMEIGIDTPSVEIVSMLREARPRDPASRAEGRGEREEEAPQGAAAFRRVPSAPRKLKTQEEVRDITAQVVSALVFGRPAKEVNERRFAIALENGERAVRSYLEECACERVAPSAAEAYRIFAAEAAPSARPRRSKEDTDACLEAIKDIATRTWAACAGSPRCEHADGKKSKPLNAIKHAVAVIYYMAGNGFSMEARVTAEDIPGLKRVLKERITILPTSPLVAAYAVKHSDVDQVYNPISQANKPLAQGHIQDGQRLFQECYKSIFEAAKARLKERLACAMAAEGADPAPRIQMVRQATEDYFLGLRSMACDASHAPRLR